MISVSNVTVAYGSYVLLTWVRTSCKESRQRSLYTVSLRKTLVRMHNLLCSETCYEAIARSITTKEIVGISNSC